MTIHVFAALELKATYLTQLSTTRERRVSEKILVVRLNAGSRTSVSTLNVTDTYKDNNKALGKLSHAIYRDYFSYVKNENFIEKKNDIFLIYLFRTLIMGTR